MNARTLPWFEDDSPRDLARWAMAGAIVVFVHAAVIGGYFLWRPADEDVGDDTSVVAIELTVRDVDQVEQAPVDQPPPPQQTTSEVTIPEEKPPEPVPQPTPAPRTSLQSVATAKRIDPAWATLITKQLQRYKNYPSSARARNEQGVVKLAFTVDRNGHVVSRQIIESSGYPDLDAEVLTMLDQAQPLPAFAPSMTQEQQDITVPVRFSLR
jgi:periplasmic protein TonB